MTESTNPLEGGLVAAVELGWRVAELYALVDDTGEPSSDTLLPAHSSLEPADQVELQLRAAAGDARRAGVRSRSASLERLVECARESPSSREAAEAFRTELRRCHIEIEKDLWAADEGAGKAYELGNGLSDTYSRVCRSYRHPQEAPSVAWRDVFCPERIERLKKLLDDLQSRLNAGGVTVVREQLDLWCREVPRRIEVRGVPPVEDVRGALRRQTVIWRQLVGGDKQPEAYLDRGARAELRGELREMVWKRYRHWILPMTAILSALVFMSEQIVDWYEKGGLSSGAVSALVAFAGSVGITRASALLAIRGRLHQWSELLWNRAVAQKVTSVTLTLDDVLLPPDPRQKAVVEAAGRLGKRVKEAVLARREPASP
ncbi:MAG: hypothetical protein MSC31_02290 [Solirubrobacteraceae bacterium MAG38_C4-C5]|nr:hypothetical protein [Candidatus Siliceabacter maunaloa]